jgi:hypothetical protein
VYRQLRGVTEAALGLHRFLLANEGAIAFDAAGGGDPVREAIPSTPELGRDMWARVDSITASLDALGALDQVTTERLMGLITAKLQTIPLR